MGQIVHVAVLRWSHRSMYIGFGHIGLRSICIGNSL